MKPKEVKPGCSNCIKKCPEKITEERRIAINNEFWKLKDKDRETFVRRHTSSAPVALKIGNQKRKTSICFYLKNNEGQLKLVCPHFFSTTLGFENSDHSLIKAALTNKSSDNPTKHVNQRKIPLKKIDGLSAKESISCVQEKNKSDKGEKKSSKASEEKMEKNCVKPGCSNCRRMCSTLIPEKRRIAINRQYWNLNSVERKKFVRSHMSSDPVGRRTAVAADPTKRTISNSFFLKDSQGELKPVCRSFFLTTLGYNESNDSVIRTLVKNRFSENPTSHQNKGRVPVNKIDDELIKNHVSMYEATENQSQKSEPLNLAMLHRDFLSRNPTVKCTYEKYRQVARDMVGSTPKLPTVKSEPSDDVR